METEKDSKGETMTDDLPTVPKEVSPELQKIINKCKDLDRPVTIDEVVQILGSTVKHDNFNKALTFLSMLLTYTAQDQINCGFLAESSTGKSYIPIELSQYFPSEDVVKISYASPTSFWNEPGNLEIDPADDRDVPDEHKHRITHIDLEKKLLIFLDQPHDQLLQRLRPLLSHDEKELVFKITNKTQKYGNRTRTIIIHGFPSVMFCTAKTTMHEQEKTRLLLLSPEMTQEKYREAIDLRIDREGDREAFKKRLDADPLRQFLADRVARIKGAHIEYVKITPEMRTEISQHFNEQHPYFIGRHMRDINRLLSIIKACALLNFMHRKREETAIYVSQDDILTGFSLYANVSEANEMGMSPELWAIWKELEPEWVEAGETGIIKKEYLKLFYQHFHKVIGSKSADEHLETFLAAGLISDLKDMVDKRLTRYSVMKSSLETQNYIPADMGTTAKNGTRVQGDIVSKPELRDYDEGEGHI
jgi:hypothetical protein